MVRKQQQRFGWPWVRVALIRAFKTFFQTALAVLTVSSAASIIQANWVGAVDAGAMAAVISVITSLAGLPELKSQGNGS